jgi:hypothetical protein
MKGEWKVGRRMEREQKRAANLHADQYQPKISMRSGIQILIQDPLHSELRYCNKNKGRKCFHSYITKKYGI